MDISEALKQLEAGQYITRKGLKFTQSSYFLHVAGGKKYLFIRSIRPHSGEVVVSPATMDYDDLREKNWKVVAA